MSLILVGLNHRTAPVEVREQMSVAEREWPKVVEQLLKVDGVHGAALLSTCNRVEAVVSSSDQEIVDHLVEILSSRATISRERIEQHLYVRRDREVVSHLFRVASGLDSMIVGEPQIAGQVKNAYRSAQSHRTLDPTLSKLFDQTLHIAKKVRTETGIGEHAVSVPYAGVELAKKIFGDLAGLQVLLLGAGKISELTAEHLTGCGIRRVFVANRSFERAVDLARAFQGEAVQFDQIESYLRSCDIVIASTSAPHYVVTAQQVAQAMATRKRRDLFLIDLSVPRNLDPGIGVVEGAYLYNIDDLREVA
ncbi:MAG TPA: glutamyl-tRNA reductase, partial [Thermoanaerobaculia bacterium]